MPKYSHEYEYWSKRAEIFDKASCNVKEKCARDGKEEWVIKQFKDTDVVLEIGCGTGIYSALIANNVSKLVVTDMSCEMLELAKTRLSQYDNVEVRREDCYRTSFVNDSFDTIFAANLMHVVADPISILEESKRVLKSGGRIVLIDYTFYNMSFIRKTVAALRYIRDFGLPPSSAKSLSPVDLIKISEESGFAVEESILIGDESNAVGFIGTKP